MATAVMTQVVRHLRRAAWLGNSAEIADAQLVEAFVARRDEAAFETLVRRHGPMVFGVCRRVLNNAADAEDAFQATFLVLVRKAAAIRPRDMVANWLYGVAYRTAMKARSSSAKRANRERQSARPEAVEANGHWDDLLPLLDRELERLPASYRTALVLCDLEGKTRKEAARQLRWPEGTVATRLTRARVLLAKRLRRRGVTLSAGALASVLSQGAASASMPISVVDATIQAANLVAAGQATAAVISTKAAALTEGMLKIMLLSKLKAMAVVLIAVALVGVAGLRICSTLAAAGTSSNARSALSSLDEASKAKDDKDSLEGIWKGGVAEVGGRPIVKAPGDNLPKVELLVQGDQLTLRGPNLLGTTIALGSPVDNKFTFKVNIGKNPKEIDLTRAPDPDDVGLRVYLGVYALEENQLRVCINMENKKRPTELKTRANSAQVLLVLQRAAGAKWQELPQAPGVPQYEPPQPKAEPPLDDQARGVVKEVNKEGLARISLGGLKDIQTNELLEVFRLEPRPEYVGQLRVVDVHKQEAVGRAERWTRAIQAGDQVARQIIEQAKPKEKAAPDMQLFQGVWLEYQANGEIRENGQKMVFTGNNFTWGSVIDWEAMKGTFKIDPTQKLKELDFTFTRDEKVVTGKCIYILEGDLLKVCYSEPNRPKAFKDVSPNLPRIYWWKRQKADDKGGQAGAGKGGKPQPKAEISTFSPDGTRVAVAAGMSISVFQAQSGKKLIEMLGHTGPVTALSYSPDGKVLASGGRDKMICVWDGAVGKQLLQMRVPAAPKAIVFSADGRTLIVHEADRSVRELDLATGKEVRVTKEKEKQQQ